jgi:hypothetical protein
MNDSFLFPMSDLGEFFERLRNQSVGIFGLTRNKVPRSHVQSYFLALKGDCIKNYMSWINDTLENWEFISRSGLISTLEINIDHFANKFNAVAKALYEDVSQGSGDVTYSDWDKLPKFGVPILKVVVLRKLLSGQIGDPDLLREKLISSFPTSEISVDEILNHGRHVESSRST